MNLSRIIAWRDSLYRKWRGAPGKTVQPKNPVRVQAGKKAAETRRRNKEIAAALEKWEGVKVTDAPKDDRWMEAL